MIVRRYDFDQLAPWVTRPLPPGAQDLPAADNCVSTRGGRLALKIKGDPLRTGHVWIPPEKLTVTYGRVRARMRFLSPRGAHSCLWLQSVPPYATAEHHEIDIAEHFGVGRVHHTIHWVDDSGPRQEHYASSVDADQWHTYEVEITPDGYTFLIDGEYHARTATRAAAVPKTLILSMLSDDWERERYGLADPLSSYKTLVDWVEVID